jgi:hypothetical protein
MDEKTLTTTSSTVTATTTAKTTKAQLQQQQSETTKQSKPTDPLIVLFIKRLCACSNLPEGEVKSYAKFNSCPVF